MSKSPNLLSRWMVRLQKMAAKVRCLPEQNHYRPRQIHDKNKRKIIWIVVLVMCSIEIPEIPTYIAYYLPDIKTHERDWYILPGFHYPMAEFWYYKFTCVRVGQILRTIAFAKTANQYSTMVFLAVFICLCYQIFDLIMLWINFNTWTFVYEAIILYVYILIKGIVKPYKPDSFARIKSMF